MSIGTVLETLKPEFPAVTISKLRFLEDQGLVTPHRTGSGYRRFSRADVERIRYALVAQRDSYLPLRVIREQLADLDAGHSAEPAQRARMVSSDGELLAPGPSGQVSARELCDLTGCSEAELEEMQRVGLLDALRPGRFAGRAVAIVQAAMALNRHGIGARELRRVRTAAERAADTIEQTVSPPRRGGADRERAAARARELAELYATLHAELLRAEVDKPA
ncbi:MerR-like DNA binding protein [Bogoriella caseilytica]|uniref:MerR-like DNA binding protein n=2 Tax=Bogoriella caseilytica TaxID=56055 RepID=A0A3N2BGR0_9MICO|nr:MerR-like DNA binding protein [Bogoriella caseilytica]